MAFTGGTAVNSTESKGNATERAVILVVDDERGPRESLRIILDPMYEIVVAENGQQGLELFERKHPDVVISDIRMPGMTGTQLLNEVKARSPETPVILITGYATVATAQEAVRGSAFDYISKPYNVADIQDLVRRALAECSRRRQGNRVVHQLQEWNKQLEEQIVQLDQKATVAELSAELIHDLNNPMTAMRGYIALLEESLNCAGKSVLSEEQHEFLDILKNQVERCVQLTRNFLNFAGPARDSWDEVNVTELIEETLFLLRVRMVSQNVQLKTALDPDLPRLWLMRTSIQQVCYNLISNGIDAITSTGMEGTMFVGTGLIVEPDGREMLRIVIQDDGPGIAATDLKKVFTPFYSTKPRGEGTGLGLPICKRVVEHHQGRLDVDTEEGRGTTFAVILPAHRRKPEGAEPAI